MKFLSENSRSHGSSFCSWLLMRLGSLWSQRPLRVLTVTYSPIQDKQTGIFEGLAKSKRYTIEQAMKRILISNELPQYDAIAIDEVQDLSLLAIRAILKMRKDAHAWVYISGDENQNIYQRDFTWKELGEGTRGYTITLHENKRNAAAIEAFANGLVGKDAPLCGLPQGALRGFDHVLFRFPIMPGAANWQVFWC